MSELGRFIVVFKSTASEDEIKKVETDISGKGGNVGTRYTKTMKGFSAEFPPDALSSLQSTHDSIIDYIEPDGEVHTQ